MALTLENVNNVKKRTRWEILKPGASEALRALWHHFEQLNNPDLQLVAVNHAGADIVIADVACKLYALYQKKPSASTVDAWIKISDHATVAAANGDVVMLMIGTGGGGQEHCMIWPDGLKLGTGATTASHTTVNGNTDSSAADRCTGWAIVGAA